MEGYNLLIWDPPVLITNNGQQFLGAEFDKFYEDQGILHHLTMVAHPQANGEVKVTN